MTIAAYTLIFGSVGVILVWAGAHGYSNVRIKKRYEALGAYPPAVISSRFLGMISAPKSRKLTIRLTDLRSGAIRRNAKSLQKPQIPYLE